MADDIIDIDGFEKYGPLAYTSLAALDANTANSNFSRPTSYLFMRPQGFNQEWTTLGSFTGNPSSSIITGLQGFGRALGIAGNSGNGIYASRALPANYPRIMIGFALASLLKGASGIAIQDGAYTQCLIWVNNLGRIVVGRGNSTVGGATALWTSPALILTGVRNYIEFDITLHSSAGAFRVWLNGTLLVSMTGQNTVYTSDNYTNSFSVQAADSAAFDDMYWADNTGGTRTPFGDRTVYGLRATGDSDVHFARGPSVIGSYSMQNNGYNYPTTNSLTLISVTPNGNRTLNSLGMMPAGDSAAAKFKGVVYTDIGGGVTTATLLATGTEVIGCANGTPLILPFASPPTLTGGAKYWIGYISDSGVNFTFSDSYTNLSFYKGNAYTSGPPSSPGGMTNYSTWMIWGNCAPPTANVINVNNEPAPLIANAPLAYNSSANPGDKDLYSFAALPLTPAQINTVKVSVLAQRSDSGPRTMTVQGKSGAVLDPGTNPGGVTPPTSMQWVTTRFPNDPATGAAWTAAAINAFVAGPLVAS